MKNIVRKTVLLVVAAILALAALTALSACGKSDEEVIRDGLAESFGALKDTSSAEFKEISELTQGQFAAEGITIDNFMGMWLEGYDYTINEIKVNGSDATAQVTIMAKQLGPVLDEVFASMQNGITYDNVEAAIETMSKTLSDRLASAQPVLTDVTVSCAKDNNEWQLSGDFQNEVLWPALYGESEFSW